MFHEILVALIGHTGAVIVEAPTHLRNLTLDQLDEEGAEVNEFQENNKLLRFHVSPSISFLSSAEAQQISELV